MNRMAETFPVSISGDADNEMAISAVIHSETQAFMDADFEAWASCFVQAYTDLGAERSGRRH